MPEEKPPSAFEIAKSFADAAEKEDQPSEQEQFIDFDRRMNRMMKGIVGRKTRRAMLLRAIRQAQSAGRV